MLSYRHAFHAGNHADVLKHSTLVLILESLLKKNKPFTVFDTHAGAGVYQLDDERLLLTGEANCGIKRLLRADNIPSFLESYMTFCKIYAAYGMYPGSPEIMRCMMRTTDTLFLAELHNTEIEILKGNMHCKPLTAKNNERSQTVDCVASIKFKPQIIESKSLKHTIVPAIKHTNGFDMLKSAVPPLIKRGLIFTDPSYETGSDYTNTAAALTLAHRKWATAIIALWYPLLYHRRKELFELKNEIIQGIRAAAGKLQPCSIVCAELCVTHNPEPSQKSFGLYGSGMMIINPPYLLKEQLQDTLPYIAQTLSQEGTWHIDSIL